ncbi:MAG: hypothetical protein RLY97_635, partial [Pseudomonadota bacterium]
MKILHISALPLVLVASPVLAQSTTQTANTDQYPDIILTTRVQRDDTITVVATGNRQPLNQTGQSISVIGAAEIASIQGPDITRILTRLPGVSVARSGPLGSQTSLFVRGGNSEQLLVLVDGVRVNDVAAPSGGYDFGGLLSGGIGKVELLRGSNSVVWGSDAISGVVAITSREMNGAEASVEYGNHHAVDGNISAGVNRDGYALTLNGGYTSTGGISAAAIGTEADGFHQWHLSARGRLRLADSVDLVATGRYATSKLDIDGYPAPFYSFADTPEYQTSKQASGRVGLVYKGDNLTLNGGVALSDMRRAYFDPTFGTAPNYTTNGR